MKRSRSVEALARRRARRPSAPTWSNKKVPCRTRAKMSSTVCLPNGAAAIRSTVARSLDPKGSWPMRSMIIDLSSSTVATAPRPCSMDGHEIGLSQVIRQCSWKRCPQRRVIIESCDARGGWPLPSGAPNMFKQMLQSAVCSATRSAASLNFSMTFIRSGAIPE